MWVAKFIPRLAAAGAALCALSACSTLRQWTSSPLDVSQVRVLQNCNSDGPQTRVSLFASPEEVRAWQERHKVDLIGVDPLPLAGAYALVEMGIHTRTGYGLAVSRQAAVDDGIVELRATLFSPEYGHDTPQIVNSPCVLVAFPAGRYRGAEVRDPAGAVLADVTAPVQ
jgi:hypothetical protein